MGLAFPVVVVAVIVVAGVVVAKYLVAAGTGSEAADAPFMAIQHSNTLTMLESERQQLIDMNAAARTLTVAAKPKVVSPSRVMASSSPSANAGTGTGSSEPTAPIPSAGTAKSIGYNMLPSFGFSQSTQWGCLDDLWMHESGWVVDAENASGAYGIPQALPASKMASAGSDYLTNPATQIKWGLGYIKSTYGTPCAAWNFELKNNFY
jgi:Transglycosylase SLT domain